MPVSERKLSRLRHYAQTYIVAADEAVYRGDYGAALRPNRRAVLTTARLCKAEPDNSRHVAVLGSLYYNRALFWDRVGSGRDSVDSARQAVRYYYALDPTNAGARTVADAVDDFDPIRGGGPPLDGAELIACLADARARLARLLGAYASDDDRRTRSPDPSMTVYHEINVLDAQAYRAYEALIRCSRYTQADLSRVKQQGDEALRVYFERFPTGPA